MNGPGLRVTSLSGTSRHGIQSLVASVFHLRIAPGIAAESCGEARLRPGGDRVKTDLGTASAGTTVHSRSRTGDFLELTKPRITLLVIVTTLAGFYLGLKGDVPLILLWHTLLGTALVAGGAGALNMYSERHLDALMRRTMDRPLPAGRLGSREALAFSCCITITGIAYLLAFVNALTSLVAAITLASYLFVTRH